MSKSQSGTLVFFGVTGDPAYKKIFASLQAMVKHGHLDVPIIGAGRSDRTAVTLEFALESSDAGAP